MPATEEKKKLEPKVQSKDVGPCKLEIAIEVSAEKVKERIEAKYKEVAETADIAGFRKGHAPRPLLERRYGKAILDDLKWELLNDSFEETKDIQKLEPVGEPDVDVEKLEVQDGKSFAYKVTIEVRPTVEVKDYAGLKVKKIEAKVEDADVEKELEVMRDEKAQLTPTDGPIQKDDQVIYDLELKVEGKTKDKADNVAIVLNEDITLYGAKLEGFDKLLLGKSVGAAVDHAFKIPETAAEKDVAGKQAQLHVTVRGIKRRELPKLDDAFAKTLDLDSLQELKDDLRKHILKAKERENRSKQAAQVMDQIVKANPFPLPEGLIDANLEENAKRLQTKLLMDGKKEEEVEAELAKHEKESRENLARALRERYILEHIAQKEKIFVTEDEVDERIAQLGARTGQHPNEMRAFLEQQGMLAQLRRSMREEATLEYLLGKAVQE